MAIDLEVIGDTEEQSLFDNPYVLMSRSKGTDINEFSHLLQSIEDLLTTPIGARIDSPEYGSYLPSLLDKPFTAAWRAKAAYYTVEALKRWEPRLYVFRATFKLLDSRNGRIVIDLYGIYLLNGQTVKYQNMTLDFKKDL